MKIIKNPTRNTWGELTKRPIQSYEAIEATVKLIFKEVAVKGDAAICKYADIFDGVRLENLKVTEAEIQEAVQQVSTDLKAAIQLAKNNIERFHLRQKSIPISLETMPGVMCWLEKKPIQKVGLYIPGGTAPLFSTVLMLAIPAQLAGCTEIVLCSPPDLSGKINPAILYAAHICGVTTIIKSGGIPAIAGMTFGTETIPKVYKIVGPGNQFVTGAKQFATQFGTAIDMPAGPSELLVFADTTANASFVAADLLSQAEHGKDSQVVLVSTSVSLLQKVIREIPRQLAGLPRQEIVKEALRKARFIYMESEIEALDFINEYAPEHFIICASNEAFFIRGIQNAGSVFVGNYSPESAGDYASGTNHTLPTNGFARNYSGITLDSFQKTISFQKLSPEGILAIGKSIEVMAAAEGLEAHKNAVTIRIKALQNEKS
ncbi:histidinol dehydrogenase [Flavobacterium supellecticarium]|uniref:Histidinol dehydrogenase n=1 Tax=Flavobacterium supellecticarium TaxID=2565924 RepID=A0A4S4A3N7_9FLAO|nr:histidinol dehydrogenase [Flavobacterium supellecticarium]THF53050.1 histidinol dehydrogenase [Flavobacterium supellecticarium]